MKRRTLGVLIFLSLAVAGCSSDEPEKAVKKSEENIQEVSREVETEETETSTEPAIVNFDEFFKDVPEVPETIEDFINQAPGKYVYLQDGWREEAKKDIENMPPLPKEPTDEQYQQYFNYVYSMVAEDFPNPEDLVKKLEFSMFGNPDIEDPRYQFKDHYNIEIILDSSGSMAELVNGTTRMELAKNAIKEFIASAPEEANVSLRVYGHKGSGSDTDKEMSCKAIDQVYGFGPYKEESFQQALDQFKPSGWTPIAQALQQSMKEFEPYDSTNHTNLIYLVSDGIETCDGNPIAVAKSFSDSNISPIINVIGFNADSEAQQQLKAVAESADGMYTNVSDGDQLKEEFEQAQKVLEEWEKWKKDALKNADFQRVDNSIQILFFTDDWNRRGLFQATNISTFLQFLQENEKIDVWQYDHLMQMGFDLEKVENGYSKKMEKEFKELSKSNLEEVKRKIEENYNLNTQ